MNSNIHKLFGQKTNYYQIKALDFVSCSYLLIIGLLPIIYGCFLTCLEYLATVDWCKATLKAKCKIITIWNFLPVAAAMTKDTNKIILQLLFYAERNFLSVCNN
jgi:hypothetical protein